MKYTINHISTGEDEVIVNYLRMTSEVERIVNFIKGEQTKLIGWKDKEQKLIDSPLSYITYSYCHMLVLSKKITIYYIINTGIISIFQFLSVTST